MSLLLVLLGLPLRNDEVTFVKQEHLPQGKVRNDDPVDLKALGQASLVLVHVVPQDYFRHWNIGYRMNRRSYWPVTGQHLQI